MSQYRIIKRESEGLYYVERRQGEHWHYVYGSGGGGTTTTFWGARRMLKRIIKRDTEPGDVVVYEVKT